MPTKTSFTEQKTTFPKQPRIHITNDNTAMKYLDMGYSWN